MKLIAFLFTALFTCAELYAHDLSAQEANHSHAKPPVVDDSSTAKPPSPTQAAPFALFAPTVKTRWDDRFLYIESHGLPSHDMMVGITAWQQQVPLPPRSGATYCRMPPLSEVNMT